MRRVTVVIPTAARPETLRVTLRSVAGQTAIADVAEIVVSENLGDRRSEAVVAEFPGLPITYRFREPQLEITAHVAQLLREAETPYVALVCDDDLWAPGHLQVAVDALEKDPGAAAHLSAYFASESELCSEGNLWGPGLLWLAAGRPERFSKYSFGLEEILALCWIFTPFTFSSLVARSSAACDAGSAMTDSPHSFYSDRMLYPALARHGRILYDPAIDVLYRQYSGNWIAKQEPELLKAQISTCWRLIEELSAPIGLDLAGFWRQLLAELPEEIAGQVSWFFHDRFSAAELDSLGFSALVPPAPKRSLLRKVGGRLIRAIESPRQRP